MLIFKAVLFILLIVSFLSIVYSGYHYIVGCCGYEEGKNGILLGGIGIIDSLLSFTALKIFLGHPITPFSLAFMFFMSALMISAVLNFISNYFYFKKISIHNRIEKTASFLLLLSVSGLFILAVYGWWNVHA